VLLAEVLGEDRLAMLGGRRPLHPAEIARFAALLDRRRAHEPVAYILGRQEFWALDLAVTPDVLIPRADTETLIEAALVEVAAPATILDLGTGSGALLLAALAQWPDAHGLGVDRSTCAVAVAIQNARRVGLAARAAFIAGDWATAIDARFDLLLCNPPYVEAGAVLDRGVAQFEPASALYAGADGLDCYRRILPDIPRLLTARGAAIFEVGRGQAGAVAAIARGLGMETMARADLAGIDRAIMVRFPASGLGKHVAAA
jgi:release factor glutamine methyltransferase